MQTPQVQYSQVPITMQPMVVSQETKTVVVNQPTTRQWDSGLCSCFDDMYSFCCSFFLGPLYYACVANSMGENCCVGCSGHSAGVVPGGHMAMRAAFRNKHGIPGSICDDCIVMTCCTPCGMCQMARQMNQYGYERKGCC